MRQSARRFITAFTVCAVVAFLIATNAHCENWPGWRGPRRNGISNETRVPTRWTDSEGIQWKVPIIDSGGSSPIVWEDKIFLTAADGPRKSNLHVICLSRDTGKEIWHRQFWGTAPTLFHDPKGSMATPAPVTDGSLVFAFFGTGDVFCLDVAGDLHWQRSLAGEYGEFENRFGAASSPVVYDGTLILQCDHYGASYIVAIDKQTGANRWKVNRPECWLSWSSPQLVPVGERFELVVSGSHKVDAFNPASGEKLWTVQGMARECIPTPVFGDGLVFVVSGPNNPTLAIRPGGTGDVTASHVAWQNQRGAPFVPSAIVVGAHYYLVDDQGIGTCLDAQKGKLLWQKRFAGAYSASPVAAEGRVYFTDEAGTTIVVDANEKRFREVSRNSLGEPVFASPAISDGRIFIRSASHLFAIQSTDANTK